MDSKKNMENSSSWSPSVKKLLGRENYNSWKFGMEMYLTAEDLWGYITGEDEDTKKDSKARAKICLLIDESLYPIVKCCKTAKEIWEKLENTYED